MFTSYSSRCLRLDQLFDLSPTSFPSPPQMKIALSTTTVSTYRQERGKLFIYYDYSKKLTAGANQRSTVCVTQCRLCFHRESIRRNIHPPAPTCPTIGNRGNIPCRTCTPLLQEGRSNDTCSAPATIAARAREPTLRRSVMLPPDCVWPDIKIEPVGTRL